LDFKGASHLVPCRKQSLALEETAINKRAVRQSKGRQCAVMKKEYPARESSLMPVSKGLVL